LRQVTQRQRLRPVLGQQTGRQSQQPAADHVIACSAGVLVIESGIGGIHLVTTLPARPD